jgi:phosphatidylglycerol---prolipoprotein diacylglyceryl transferase
MYPRLTDLLRDFVGIDPPFDLYTYGLMVATSILLAAWLTRIDLDRKYREGQIGPIEIREKTAKGRTRAVQTSPSAIVWTMMIVAAFFGVVGAKIFHIIDNFGQFMLTPGRYLLTPDGLAFYGGLIGGSIAVLIFVRRKGLNVGAVFDSIAPGLMLGYGVGRIGCWLAGDGDWGICSSLADKPAFIPGFLWSETFPQNILGRDLLAECGPAFDGVYPTMLYEFAMGAILAGVLWSMRKHKFQHGWLFFLYFVFAGVQRFTIEQIRVNIVMFEIGGFEFTQAMFISVILVVAGIIGLVVLGKRRETAPPVEAVG